MNSMWKCLARLAPPPPNYNFKSQLFLIFNKRGPPHFCNHPLDTDLEEYDRVIKEVVVPDCLEIADKGHPYRERLKELLIYTHTGFGDCWNYPVELCYKMVAPKEHQTKENLFKMRILRACMDLSFNQSAVLDDLADGTTMRMHKPTWHKVCTGGDWAAGYDAIVVSYLPFLLLRKYFADHPHYALLQQNYAFGNLRMFIGELLDVLGLGIPVEELPTASDANTRFKAAHFVEAQSPLGLIHAGIEDPKILRQAKDIHFIFGELIQTWDDFVDYYINKETRGEPPADLINGGVSWSSITASKQFNQEQMARFKECYGSSDPKKMEEAKKLYDEVELPYLYVKRVMEADDQLTGMIEAVPHEGVRNCYNSYKDWFMADLAAFR